MSGEMARFKPPPGPVTLMPMLGRKLSLRAVTIRPVSDRPVGTITQATVTQCTGLARKAKKGE